MMTTQGGRLLAELHGDTARAWQAFADANGVSVEALLDALGPILRRAGAGDLGLQAVLREAVAAVG